MINIEPAPFWVAISLGYLILSIGVFMTWLKLRIFITKVESPLYLTPSGIGIGGDHEGTRINVEKLFFRLVTANMIAMILSAIGAVLTFI